MASSKSSISAYRKNNAESVLEIFGIRSSLLVHPHGMQVMKEYKKIKAEGLSGDEQRLAEQLHAGLENVILQKETAISSAMREVLETHWKSGTAAGERNESVAGESQGVKLTGHPDVVLRVAVVKTGDAEDTEEEQQEDDGNKSSKLVSNIFEIAVDDNGGEKKHLQAFDYARFIPGKGEAFLFFVMRVDRKQEGCKVAITQESFIFKDSEEAGKGKYGFLWREYYVAKSDDGILSTLKEACQGIVRSIHCSTFLQKIVPHDGYWKTFHNNVAVEGSLSDDGRPVEKWVYKVFDNRFLPTQRNPENWLNKQWTEHLQVEQYLVYEETPGVQKYLGKPIEDSTLRAKKSGHNNPSPRKKLKSETDKILEDMPYGTGSIVVIRYKYQNGTHIASKLSHLQDIARSIKEMHEWGFVHGDIRGHNLLHPSDQDGSITQSCLLDFDFSGKAGVDKYPVGLNPLVPENAINPRSVKEGAVMQKVDDWIAFGSAIGVYLWDSAGDTMVTEYQNGEVDMNNPTKDIDEFIKEKGDLTLDLRGGFRGKYHEETPKGTGSPGDAKARGRLSTSRSASRGS